MYILMCFFLFWREELKIEINVHNTHITVYCHNFFWQLIVMFYIYIHNKI